ncbi:hypothetical protein RMR21_022235 [Agrobacterium sp. rho-8.1]|nr:hypothetical protein [Agrobacterium sp. rho-8.1]
MNRILSGFGTAVIAAVMTATSFGMASAAPIVAQPMQISSGVELVQYRDDRRPMVRRDRDRRDRAEHRRERRGYWNGHRGYREHRKGYRRHSDGYYYAPSVFRLMIR